jgi:hypothetical protein
MNPLLKHFKVADHNIISSALQKTDQYLSLLKDTNKSKFMHMLNGLCEGLSLVLEGTILDEQKAIIATNTVDQFMQDCLMNTFNARIEPFH